MKNKSNGNTTGSAPIPYFSVRRRPEEQMAEIYIFGNIRQQQGGLSGLLQANSDQSSYDLANQIAGIPDDWGIVVHINSNGGELKEGLGIYNVLKEREVTTICEGFAASAGSVIFAAGKRRIMQPASLLFIHQAYMDAQGNADEFAKLSEDLKIITESAIAAYKESGINVSDEELDAMIKAETWIKPEDAVRMGFATEISAEEEDEEIQNDAMRSIMAAVTWKPEDTARTSMESKVDEMYAAFKEIMSAAEAKPTGFAGILAAWLGKYAPNTAPEPAPGGHKGFFNFRAPENGRGGEKA